MKKRILFVILLTFTSMFAYSLVNKGQKAPFFKVMSGYEKWVNSNTFKGKVIVGFYETRDLIELNRPLKTILNNFYYKNKPLSVKFSARLAVVDATGANFLTRWIWRRKLRNASVKEKMIIYGDWDGSMRKSFGFPEDKAIFFIIDKKGYIIYFHIGRVPKIQYKKILLIIEKKVLENQEK